MLGVTLTQEEIKALVANEETTRFTRGLSSLLSLLLKRFFSFVFGGTCTLLYLWWRFVHFGMYDGTMHTCALFVFWRLFLALC